MNQSSQLDVIRQNIADCTLCPLHKSRNRAVPGEGNPYTEIALIGEAPGWNEDKEGRPFIGVAGSVLNELLAGIGLKREDIYILNVLNCRPPRNRDPKTLELDTCRLHLDAQLGLLPNLKVIVAMGRYASLSLCPSIKPKDMRNKARFVDGVTHLFLYHQN